MSKVKIQMVGDKQLQKQLKRLDERVRKRVLKKTARKALKPVVRLYKSQITDSDEVFAVYRNGSVYAEIIPGQLRQSIGIKFPKQAPGVVGGATALNENAEAVQGTPEDTLKQLTAEAQAIAQAELHPGTAPSRTEGAE